MECKHYMLSIDIMMKERKNNLDEMQEQKLLKIEHYGTWFAFWGLLAAILIQVIIGGKDLFRNIAGEWIIFMCLAVYIVVACLKNGIWDRKLHPNGKTNIIVSMVTSTITGSMYFVFSYLKYHKLPGSAATGLIFFVITFILVLIALTISMFIYKRRLKKLEEDIEAQTHDEH